MKTAKEFLDSLSREDRNKFFGYIRDIFRRDSLNFAKKCGLSVDDQSGKVIFRKASA